MGTSKKELKLKDVVTQMKDDGCEFFVDSSNQPTVMIKDDGFQQDWPANHERVQDYIITLYYDLSEGESLRPADLQLLMALLREECRNGERRLSQAEEAETDGDVLVQAVLLYLSAKEEFDGKTVKLLNELKLIEVQKLSYASEIPAFVNVFSRRLRRRIPMLRGFGVSVTLEHKEQGSFCRLTRLENFQPEDDPDGSAALSSGVSSGQGTSMASPDDTDGHVRKESRREESRSSATKGGGK
ncbi:hypothetical protein [Rubinisphaera sp. JC750]|uniref:hypothetical protein n=1 Tax=Rubinisphaera sp. JC750 TaxID=2898658 RepID=UPI001F4176A6|nr:hypothetical protein [Rubinisphaera sp. JC750]